MGARTDALRTESQAEIKQRIGRTRETISMTLDELERRRREALDVRLQLRRHPAAFAVTAGVLIAAVALSAWAIHRRGGSEHRARLVREALLCEYHPELLTRPYPSASRKIATSALAAAARVAARHLTVRAIEHL